MKITLKILSLILVLGLSLAACGDDDGPTPPEEPPTGMDDDGPIGMDDDEPSPPEVESAWFISYRNVTPQGRVFYMEVKEEIPSETNSAEAVELGLNADVYSFSGNPYTWNGSARTVTKWDVDRTTLELSTNSILSLATTGISRFRPLFLSETQAFVTNLAEGLIVEWNPSTMEITETYNVDPLPDLGTELVGYRESDGYLLSDKIVWPIWMADPTTCCENSDLPQPSESLVAIFDVSSGMLQYSTDDRQYANEAGLLLDPTDGSLYLYPSSRNALVPPYFDTTGLPNGFSYLRINQDGSFDPDFNFDLTEVLDVVYIRSSVLVFDNKLAVNYIDDADYDFPAAYQDRYDVFSAGDLEQSVLIDLDTKEVTPFTALEGWNGSSLLNTIDGVNYYAVFNTVDGIAGILRQDGATNLTQLSTHNGGSGFETLDKLW